MSEPDWTTHIASGAAWKRFGIMLLLAPILGCLGFFIAFVALFQFLSVLANGENSPHLRQFGEDLGRYAKAIIDYLTYNSEHRPFPFAARTEGRASAGATASRQASARTRPTAASGRKTQPRKRKATTRKTTARKRSTTKKTTRQSGTRDTRPPAADAPSEQD